MAKPAKNVMMNAAKNMQHPPTKEGAEKYMTTAQLMVEFARAQADFPLELTDAKIINHIAITDALSTKTLNDISQSKYPIAEILNAINVNNDALAQVKTTYPVSQSNAQRILPLRDSEKNLHDERSALRKDFDKVILNVYPSIIKIMQEGKTALDNGTSLNTVKSNVDKQLNDLLNSTQKEIQKLRERATKLDLNENALQKKLNTLDKEIHNVSLAAGVPIQPAPTSRLVS
jgi:hypothetical protein